MAASGIRMGKVFVEIGADPSKLFGALNRINKRLGRVGASMQNLGGRMAGMGVALAAPVALMSKHFASFDDAIRATAAVTGSLGSQGAAALAMMTDKARELGATTSFTAVEVANLMTALGRAGFKPKEITGMTDAVLSLARATGTDATESAGIMAATLRQFGLDATQAARAADLLTYAANNSFNTVTDLGDSLKYAGPVAKSLGMSLEDTVAVLGVLGNVGIQGSQAGTAIRRLATITAGAGDELQSLFGVSNTDAAGKLKPMVDVLDEINAATANMSVADRTAKMAKAFGLLGITSANVLAGSADSVRAFADGMNSISGLSQTTAQAMDSGLGGSMRKAFSAIEGTALAIGEALAPSLQSAVDFVTNLAGAITALIKDNQDMVVAIGKGIAGFIGLGVAIYGAGAALSVVSAALGLVLSPTTLIVGAIAAVGAGIAYASGEMSSFGAIAVSAFGGIYDAIAGGDLGMAMEILMAALWAGWTKGSEILLNGMDWFGSVMFETLAMAAVGIKAFFLGTIDNLVNGVMAAFDTMVAAVRKSWNYVQSFLKKGYDLAAENNKVDTEMAARARARGVSRPGMGGRLAQGREEYRQAFENREITRNAVKAQRARASDAAAGRLTDLTQQAAAKRQDVSAARELETSITAATGLDELGGLGGQLASLIERGNLSTDREQQLIDAYNQASQRIGEATTKIAEAGPGAVADPKAVRDAALQAAAAQAETVGTFASVGFGNMGFGSSLQQKANDLLGKIEQNTREPGMVGA
jgi:TP901 family phage tail tape measure protein